MHHEIYGLQSTLPLPGPRDPGAGTSNVLGVRIACPTWHSQENQETQDTSGEARHPLTITCGLSVDLLLQLGEPSW